MPGVLGRNKYKTSLHEFMYPNPGHKTPTDKLLKMSATKKSRIALGSKVISRYKRAGLSPYNFRQENAQIKTISKNKIIKHIQWNKNNTTNRPGIKNRVPEFLQMKNRDSEIKNSVEWLSSSRDMTKERISGLEHRFEEIMTVS